MRNDRTGISFLIDTYEGQDSPEETAILTFSLVGVVLALDKIAKKDHFIWRGGFMQVQLVTFDSVMGTENEYIMGEGVL